ncbi:MAG: chemotaxis protein CheA [Gammaproteobacteria bacterium]|nr:MAG: chemotaxis protein CheA [Gammaproteobacteria bacterium]
MTIDISQFVQAFLDESFEGLDLMEVELLREQALDAEQVNAIFRAAHSIKGSAGTFGFAAVSEFTHGAETLLDEVRDGKREMTAEIRGLMLEAVDRIREMLVAARDGSEHDPGRVAETAGRIEAMLASAHGRPGENPEAAASAASMPAAAPPAPQARASSPTPAGAWEIVFVPEAALLRSGNDPLRIFSWLAELGELTVHCETDALPALDSLAAEDCQLRWRLRLEGETDEAAIREAFEWVEDQCTLSVHPLAATSAPAITPPAAPETAAPETPAQPAAGAQPQTAPDGRPVAPNGAPVERRADAASIRVATEKVDTLVNMVGELVITQAMINTIGHSADELDARAVEELRHGLTLLERNTRELQEAVLSVRMLPINFVFSRFPRVVRDLSTTLGKKVNLRIIGEETELDKGLIEKLVDPLTHIVRNAIDHGIESPERRLAAGKPEAGTLVLRAGHQGGNIVIEISDDGGGLNRERILAKARAQGLAVPENPSDRDIWQLIFAPGFSTAETVTDVSGRGVGMDVVRRNIEAVNGRLDIESTAGQGTRITVRLPLTLAILDGMSVRVGEEVYILPLTAILESLQPTPDQLHSISGRGRVVRLRGDYIPLLPLHNIFNVPATHERPEDGIVVVVESAEDRAALFVDELIAQHQVVIKSLETNYRKVPGVSGATIMGDGRVAMILDVDSLTRLHGTVH